VTAETLILQIRQLFMEGNVGIRLDTNVPYDEATARRSFKDIAKAHRGPGGW